MPTLCLPPLDNCLNDRGAFPQGRAGAGRPRGGSPESFQAKQDPGALLFVRCAFMRPSHGNTDANQFGTAVGGHAKTGHLRQGWKRCASIGFFQGGYAGAGMAVQPNERGGARSDTGRCGKRPRKNPCNHTLGAHRLAHRYGAPWRMARWGNGRYLWAGSRSLLAGTGGPESGRRGCDLVSGRGGRLFVLPGQPQFFWGGEIRGNTDREQLGR